MKKQSHTTPQATENQSVTLTSKNQSVNSPAYDTVYFSSEVGGFITTRKERKQMQSRTSARTAKRSSRPVKQQQSTPDVAMHFAAKDIGEENFARVFYFGKKSDFVASAEPKDRSKTVVLINGIPHKKDGTGKYKALTFKSSTEQFSAASTFELEMYQYLFLLAENGATAADIFADLIVAATEK